MASSDNPPNRFAATAVAAMAIVATPLFFVPASLYFSNIQDVSVPLEHMVPTLLVSAAVAGAILCVLLLSLRGKSWERGVVLVLGLAVLLWLQAYLLVWDYGVLDGRNIDWTAQWWRGLVDSLVWAGILVTFFLFSSRLIHLVLPVSIAILLIQVLPVAWMWWATPEPPSFHRYSIDSTNKFDFSRDRNVVMLVLDAFQADVMQEIVDEQPKYRDMLDGFTYYRNAASGFSKTYPSFAFFLTGQRYRNEQPIQQFLREAFESHSITAQLLKSGWEVHMFPAAPRSLHFSERIASNMLLRADDRERARQTGKLLDTSLFRSSPHFLKRFWLNDYEWRLTLMFESLAGQAEERDTRTSGGQHRHPALQFVEEMRSRSSDRLEAPTFKLYHLMVPHEPFRLREDLEIERLPEGREGFKRHSVAALEVSRRLLDTLARLRIYDNTMILIISDHGGGEYDVGIRTSGLPGVAPATNLNSKPSAQLQSALPLVLIKPFNARGLLKVSDAPVSLGDIPKTLASALGVRFGYQGEDILALRENERRTRRYLFYEFGGWTGDCLPQMTEYSVTGHSWYAANWQVTGRIFPPCKNQGGARETPKGYSLGDELGFSINSAGLAFLKTGWSHPEDDFTWSEGTSSEIELPVESSLGKPLVAKFWLHPFLAPPRLSSQDVRVFANDQLVGRWTLKGLEWRGVVIPSTVTAGGNTLRLRLEVPRAGSPVDYDAGMDSRVLGIALHKAAIDELSLHEVSLGDPISFRAGGDSDRLVTHGWSHQESEHRWTDGDSAGFALRLSRIPSRSLTLSAELFPYLASGKIKKQPVTILVNGIKVGAWAVDKAGRYEVEIPAEPAGMRDFIVELQIGAPASPMELGLSPDGRRLGLGISEIVLNPGK